MKYCTVVSIVGLLSIAAWSRADQTPPSPGQPAPPMAIEKLLQTPAGAVASWDKLRGKVVVLEFWATWCGPCVEAIPHFNELADQFKDKPVQFVALTEENRRTVEAFLAKKPIHAWIGLTDHSMTQAYGVVGIPTTVVVRADGVVDAVTYPAALRPEHLQNLLAGKPSGLATLPKPVGIHAGELPDADTHTALFQIIIRPNTGGGTAMFGGGAGGGPLGREIGKSFIGYTVRDMLPLVYESSKDRLIVKGELPDGKYDLVAKIPEADEKRLGLRIRQAVESTFGLTSRSEMGDADAYVATVSQPNAKGLTRTASVNSGSMSFDPNTGKLSGVNAPMAGIMRALERGLACPVQDETKLDGRFDVDLTWDPTSAPDVKVRAVKDQLGLTLTLVKRKLELVVVEASPAPAVLPATQPAQ